MNSSTHLSAFSRSPTDRLPDVHGLEERLQIFWVLAAAKGNPSVASLTSTQIAEILCEHCGIALPRQRVAAILEKEKGRIAITRRGGRKYYKLMKVGEDELLGSGFQPMFIDPESLFHL